MVDNVEGGVVESAPYVGSPYLVCRVLIVGVGYDGEAPSLRIWRGVGQHGLTVPSYDDSRRLRVVARTTRVPSQMGSCMKPSP